MSQEMPHVAADDVRAARERMRAWWNGADIGRCALDLSSSREPAELPVVPQPEGWLTDYSSGDPDYREYLSRRQVHSRHYHAEAFPVVAPNLGPSSMAAFLGASVDESPGNVWFGPCLTEEEPDPDAIVLDESNPYWQFTLALLERQRTIAPGVVQVGYPDTGENLDVLAALRGTEQLLMDSIERPEWIAACLERLDTVHRVCYDRIAARVADEDGAVYHWMWSPGRTGRYQCDTSAMLSPDAFSQLVVPSLRRLAARHDYRIYHWDGVDALVHEPALLKLDDLDVIQWVPGAGRPPVHDPQWWPLYHRVLDAGKRVALVGFNGLDALRGLRREFSATWHRFFLRMHVQDAATARAVVDVAEGRA